MKTFLIVMLSLVIAFFAGVMIFSGVLQYKRKKLLDAWKKYAEEKGVTFPDHYVMLQLEKLGNRDINVLIDFSKALDHKDYFIALSMFGQVKDILMKTASLNDIQVLFGEILQAKLPKG